MPAAYCPDCNTYAQPPQLGLPSVILHKHGCPNLPSNMPASKVTMAQTSPTQKCPNCGMFKMREILGTNPPRYGPWHFPHKPDCPERKNMPGSAVADATELVTGDNPISTPQDVTDEMAAHDPLLPEEHLVTGAYAAVDNREELVSILLNSFKWVVHHDDIHGLTYTAPDGTTTIVFDDVYDHDLVVTRYDIQITATHMVWKVAMTRTTPLRVMLSVAMGF